MEHGKPLQFQMLLLRGQGVSWVQDDVNQIPWTPASVLSPAKDPWDIMFQHCTVFIWKISSNHKLRQYKYSNLFIFLLIIEEYLKILQCMTGNNLKNKKKTSSSTTQIFVLFNLYSSFALIACRLYLFKRMFWKTLA